jgi:SAM-dependent methyltransferase
MTNDSAADLFPVTKGGAGAVAPLYASVALASAAVIALQIAIMRIFAVGSWSHFGSLVVSLAMLGFGVSSVALCFPERWFAAHWRTAASCALASFGPLAVGVDLIAQQIPFNAIFIISDPAQKWRLAGNFVLYMVPFVAGALFLGIVFVKAGEAFGRAYFADLVGAGAAGLAMFGVMYFVAPEDLILVPTALAGAAAVCWFTGVRQWLGLGVALILTAAAATAHLALPGILGIQKLAVSDYKGVAYARRFPDRRLIYRAVSPFGDLQVYASSYLHFAPGLSDNAAFNLPETPADAYVGLYLDGDGPTGVMRKIPISQTAYFRFLPMYYPYVIQSSPSVFIARFGGGISTMVALRSNASGVTVAESNPAELGAFRDPALRRFTGDVLSEVRVIPYDGRLFLERTANRYDVVDLSLTDSTGLSNPGGFPVVEKYDYTEEAMETYIRALKPGGVLAVTVWNKEEPPKSVLKLYAAIAQAAQAISRTPIAGSFFVAASYLSTTTVLYKVGDFTPEELKKLTSYTDDMSFDVIYAPDFHFDTAKATSLLSDYHRMIFGDSLQGVSSLGTAPASTDADVRAQGYASDPSTEPPPSTLVDRLAWRDLVANRWQDFADRYVFDSHPLTDDRPYFAGYVKFGDLMPALSQVDQLQDDWGYLAIWVTLAVAFAAAVLLVLSPLLLRWRLAFSRQPGKIGAVIYFACLGLGYMMVEIALLARFVLPLENTTVSAATVIAGMLVFSGLGSFAAERIRLSVHLALPLILGAVAALLFLYGVALDPPLRWIGAQPYAARVTFALALIAPPAFLMGFPMPSAMALLAKQRKSSLFIWAWGINGCCSVLGAAAAPILAVQIGLSFVLGVSACGYLMAIPAFFLLFADKSAWSYGFIPPRRSCLLERN